MAAMKSLWFKQIYVADILSGVKSDTYRSKRPRFVVGESVAAQVGPRLPFAVLLIESIAEISVDRLSAAKRRELDALYDLSDVAILFHISFSIQQIPKMS